jgi:hypothetical protein
LLTVVCAAGCAGRSQTRLLPPRAAGNLLVGPTVWHNRVAEEFTLRPTWPSVDRGYEVENVTTYTEFIIDNQAFYDRDAGGYSREAATIRTGTWIR